ncbi:hypothetical protein [Halodesulfovibrio sp.]|jgi:hypothetical protein|uniref:hypothetical protein n=1 Tax=Halodesulfovibrio sp. TaxID=1912772 RepID=UPI0025FC1A5F|nr:hypothetical protein [Halodesulfovibrio sp.]MCT4626452.1 hypothetical protein [Halodesulfovibrio sp.]
MPQDDQTNSEDERTCKFDTAALIDCIREMQPDPNREAYLEYRKTLDQINSEQQASFDNKLLALAGTFLAFSTSFIDKVVPLSLASQLWILIFSWISLLISTLSVLISFNYSAKSASEKLTELDKRYASEQYDKIYEEIPTKYDGGIEKSNIIGLWAFFIGIFFLVIFIGCNIDQIGKKYSSNALKLNTQALQDTSAMTNITIRVEKGKKIPPQSRPERLEKGKKITPPPKPRNPVNTPQKQ